jgi:hypothetical protein
MNGEAWTMKLFGQEHTERSLASYVGDIRQAAGLLAFEYAEGPARGMRGIMVESGAGLRLTVLPDRGMDIGAAAWAQYPLAWRSARGEIHPGLADSTAYNFRDVFGGGLMVTCGLENFGPAASEGERTFAMHGSIHRHPAEQVAWRTQPGEEGLEHCVEGTVRQATAFGEQLVLRRTLRVPLGQNRLIVRDRIENRGFKAAPLLTMYHLNFGYPLIAPGTRLEGRLATTQPLDAHAAAGLDAVRACGAPAQGPEQVFTHTLTPDAGGVAELRLTNPTLRGGAGLGIAVRMRPEQLPFVMQWKHLVPGAYALALEPANAPLLGRSHLAERGKLPQIAAGKSWSNGWSLRYWA